MLLNLNQEKSAHFIWTEAAVTNTRGVCEWQSDHTVILNMNGIYSTQLDIQYPHMCMNK